MGELPDRSTNTDKSAVPVKDCRVFRVVPGLLHTYSGHSPVQIAWVRPDQFPYYGEYDVKYETFLGLLPLKSLPYFKFGVLDSDVPNHYRISFLGLEPGSSDEFQTWESVLRDYAVAKPSRPNLLVDAGGHYELRQQLRITTHRPATADEIELLSMFETNAQRTRDRLKQYFGAPQDRSQ